MHPFHVLLALFCTVSLVALFYMLRWERRYFVRREKGGAWLAVRLATIPITVATVAAVLLPALSISGMEALAVFYILLFTAAPLLWFGLHWLVGRFTRPRLLLAESGLLAGSPLALGFVVVSVAHALQGPAWLMLRAMGMDK